MSFQSFLTKIFGNKSTRDLKEIEPIVKKIEDLEPEVKQLTIDQLRERIDNVRADISQAISAEKEENERLRIEVEELPFDQRQPVWDKIDRNEKTMLDTIEDKLNEHLPEVFAVVRETAARFAAKHTTRGKEGIPAFSYAQAAAFHTARAARYVIQSQTL